MIFVALFSVYLSGYSTMVSRNERKVIFLNIFFRPFQFQEKEKTNSGKKHNKGCAWYVKLDVSYATTYILRSDSYKICEVF